MSDAINPTQEMGVSQADYLKLFMQELSYQDPLKPVDNKEFMAQMAQISSLQEAQQTNQALAELKHWMSDNNGLMLLGKKVTITGSEQEGIVSKVELSPNNLPIIHVLVNSGENPRVLLTDISSTWNPSSKGI
ncbi:flagellar hook assembly protein FlgD [Legionella drozanskii]|uniref:Basal-body rod modification protein FlgD n=1 Tax=Legionella drozanskii LLAP-1 TaxID=1212489 RepID=A0A0W0SWT5_9GAMM|nr:flagellar hook capping FlgD N-terminal domain-containing protein [Legionella drozanskii]KTC87764.1 flagellar basal body rod modification protein [Legionella drozanskii LLAP-1]